MNTRSGTYINQPTGYKAFIPKPLPPDPPVDYDEVLLSKADRELARLDGITTVLPDIEYFIAMYIKKEALLSSQIEGTQASLEGVLEFEADIKPKEDVNEIDEVFNYIKAMYSGLNRLKDIPLSLRLIKEIHEILIMGTRGDHLSPGEFRTSQNWIGFQGATLNEAEFVPPPPYKLIDSMGELENFIHSNIHIPPLVKIALIHAQFETIHPFLDGNGRIGRLLITFYLCWKEILAEPLLYLSYYFKKYRSTYYELLMKVRNEGDWESWVNFFLNGIIETSKEAQETAKKIIKLERYYKDLMSDQKIRSSYSNKLLEELFHTPIIDVRKVSTLMQITTTAAASLVKKFEEVGMLHEVTGQKRYKKYVFKEYVDIIVKGTEIEK